MQRSLMIHTKNKFLDVTWANQNLTQMMDRLLHIQMFMKCVQLQLCPVTPLSSSIYNANKLEKLIQDGPIKLEGEIEMIMSQSRSHAALNILNLGNILTLKDFFNFLTNEIL